MTYIKRSRFVTAGERIAILIYVACTLLDCAVVLGTLTMCRGNFGRTWLFSSACAELERRDLIRVRSGRHG